MHWSDVPPLLLLTAAGAVFVLAEVALCRADDAHAVYWLCTGSIALWASMRWCRGGTQS